MKKVSAKDLGVDLGARIDIVSVEEPPVRKGGATVPDVDSLIAALKEKGFIKN